MNNIIDYNELKQVIKSSKLFFSENEFENINNDMQNFMNIIQKLNNLKLNNDILHNNINFSNLREDVVINNTTKKELFENIKHELYNYGIIIPKSFD